MSFILKIKSGKIVLIILNILNIIGIVFVRLNNVRIYKYMIMRKKKSTLSCITNTEMENKNGVKINF